MSLNIEYIQNFIKENDVNHECELLSTTYTNAATPLLLKCNLCGNTFQRDFNHIRRKRFRCPNCSHIISASKRKGQFKYSLEDIKQEIKEKDGYTIIGNYINSNKNVLCQCSKGHYFNFTYSNYKNGQSKCPYCKKIEYLKNKDYTLPSVRVTLNDFLREYLKPWKNECLKYYNYTCDISHEYNLNLDVHHLINFTTIINQVLSELNLPYHKNCSEYTPEEILKIIDLFQKKHTPEIGVVLNQKYHQLFHRIYGNTNNTIEQYQKFKYLIQNNLL